MDILKIKNLDISYGNKNIVDDLSINIKENKITAIIGPSGCGKSTFLNTLNLMIKENRGNFKGEVLFKDKNILDYDLEFLRKNIGMVFQKPTAFPFSIYKNLIYALKYYGIKNKKELKEKVKTYLKIVGLSDEIEDLNMNANNLSGGQQQRLSIARALTVNPEILLLDEPCSALDVKNTKHIENMLLDFKDKYTIVIVTHNLSQARRISDYTAFILNGKLIEYNTTETIFENPRDLRTKEYVEGIYG